MKTLRQFTLVFLISLPIMGLAQWTEIEPYPATATDGAFTFIIDDGFSTDGSAYVGAGLADNRLHRYDELTGEWTRLADIPGTGTHRAWAFSFSLNGKGYVVGGSYETTSDVSEDIWEYDPMTDEWTQKSDFPGGQRDAGFVFSIGDKAYIGGGFDGQYLRNDFYSYDPSADEWTQLPDFPGGPIIFPVAFVVDGKAYVGTGAQGTEELQQVWEFDPENNTWTRKADFAGDKRQCAVAFSVGTKGYIGGGMSEYTTNLGDFWEYSPEADQWTLVENANFPSNTTAWSTAFALGTNVYFGLGVEFPNFNFSNAFYKRTFTPTAGIGQIGSVNKFQTRLYPVPASNTLFVETTPELLQTIVLDVKGREILISTEKEIDISSLPAGLYFLKINTSEGLSHERFIKRF